MKLLIVESPGKTKTLKKFLGAGFEVEASVGHVRDLPKDALGVDTATFEPQYVVSPNKGSVVARLKAAAARADEVLLATDEDREGEAIAFHLARLLGLKAPKRITFKEITAKAVLAAVAAPRALAGHLVDAQQARRVVDRLVGYQVSPLLQQAFGPNHSAGRVQTSTLHLVVLREKEREAFVKQPYWTLAAHYANALVARYATLNDAGELEDKRLLSQEAADAIAARARGPHTVQDVVTKPVERRPKPPFKTSTLQQAASVAFRWSSDRTMALAQELYEAGLITYMRTDSLALSAEAVQMARDFIAKDYPEALPSAAPVYKSKAAGAQEAHEAIRPTSLSPPAADVSAEALQLYELIRRRFLACQCKPAVLERTVVTLVANETHWRASGDVVRFPSFLKYLAEDEDSEGKGDEAPAPKLPPVKKGDVLQVQRITVERKETEPPKRYTEATLVAALERLGIGRPATYASITGQKGILFARDYLAREKQYLYPTPRGRLIDEMLEKAFPELVRADYTARVEEGLDLVAEGKRRWKEELAQWYRPFERQLAGAPHLFAAAVKSRADLAALVPEAPKPTGKPCPKCASELLLRQGPKGPFLTCSDRTGCGFLTDVSAKASERACPTCGGAMEEVAGKFGRYARCLDRDCKGAVDLAAPAAEKCPQCEGAMKDKGTFLGCASYPTCRGTLDKKAMAKGQKAGKTCPKCARLLLERKGPKGKFWGCSGYPGCKHTEAVPSKARGERGTAA
jgi:DNA topoisomerase I